MGHETDLRLAEFIWLVPTNPGQTLSRDHGRNLQIVGFSKLIAHSKVWFFSVFSIMRGIPYSLNL
jgi:hypothetical protein